MRYPRVFLCGLIVVMGSCASCDSKNPVEQYGDTVIKSYKNTQKTMSGVEIQKLQESIRTFQSMNGRFPNDLKELSDFVGSPLDSNRYHYDPSTGTIAAKE